MRTEITASESPRSRARPHTSANACEKAPVGMMPSDSTMNVEPTNPRMGTRLARSTDATTTATIVRTMVTRLVGTVPKAVWKSALSGPEVRNAVVREM